MADPRITDNDAGEITATVNGKEIRGWSYKDDAERRLKMQLAHEFAEGWFQATAAAPDMLNAITALRRADRLFSEALPKFNWAKSALDANAIALLNEVPMEVSAAIAKATGVPKP